MELYNILRSLTVDELKTVKKISTDLIKEKQPKKVTKTRDDKITDVKVKLSEGTYNLNYHELMYACEIISREHGYPVTVNIRDEIAFIKSFDVFGINKRIYFLIYTPEGFKSDYIKYQIVKQDDNAHVGGYSRVRNITRRV